MANLKHSKTQIDLTRFGFMISHKLDELDLTYSAVTSATGVSRRQISDAKNGQPISAGATFMLCHLLNISMLDLLPNDAVKLHGKIQKLKESHGVTLDVTCETSEHVLDAGPYVEVGSITHVNPNETLRDAIIRKHGPDYVVCGGLNLQNEDAENA